jgi:hypothetical protein
VTVRVDAGYFVAGSSSLIPLSCLILTCLTGSFICLIQYH